MNEKKIKIVVLGTRGFPNVQGGVEAHCENLYPRLVKKGCEVTVFSRKPYVDAKIDTYERVKLIPLPCPKDKFLEAILHTFIGIFYSKKIKPDILHIHAIGPSLFIPLARFLGLKVVMTNHGPDYERKKWGGFAKIVLKLGEFLGSKFANEIICISEHIAESIRRRHKRETTIIPNGVVMPQILKTEDTIRKYGLTKEKYILSVGRLVPEKGFHDLIDAFNKVQLDGWKLVIIGRADHEDRYSLDLKEKATRNKNIILTGFLRGSSLQELFSHAGLFVLPSYYEGLPIVLLEAMSYGLSCIVSDIPANRNLALPQERFFKPTDVEALVAKIKEFSVKQLDKEEKIRQINVVAEKYDWNKITDKTFEVYNKAYGQCR